MHTKILSSFFTKIFAFIPVTAKGRTVPFGPVPASAHDSSGSIWFHSCSTRKHRLQLVSFLFQHKTVQETFGFILVSAQDRIRPWITRDCQSHLVPSLLQHKTVPLMARSMGPIRGRQDPGGPQVGHVNLAIWNRFHSVPLMFSTRKHRLLGFIPVWLHSRLVSFRFSTRQYRLHFVPTLVSTQDSTRNIWFHFCFSTGQNRLHLVSFLFQHEAEPITFGFIPVSARDRTGYTWFHSCFSTRQNQYNTWFHSRFSTRRQNLYVPRRMDLACGWLLWRGRRLSDAFPWYLPARTQKPFCSRVLVED